MPTSFSIAVVVALAAAIYFIVRRDNYLLPEIEVVKVPPVVENVEYRIFAVGDCHGDLGATLKILEMAGIVDEHRNWAANNSILVQTGDIVDRGPDTIALYKLFQSLTQQAEAQNGKVVSLLGNHEIMNMMGHLQYVDPRDVHSFGNPAKRAREWSIEGDLGKYLRSLDTFTVVKQNLFIHAGLHPKYAIENINQIIRNLLNQNQIQLHEILIGEDSPTWYRGYALGSEDTVCPLLSETLKKMGAKRMIVGHTPQLSGKIFTRCVMPLTMEGPVEPRLYVIDLGISAAYGSTAQGLIEIIKGLESERVFVNGVYFSGKEMLNF